MKEIKTVQDLVNLITQDELVLPDFQRKFIWKEKRMINLYSSVLCRMPIGSILTLESDDGGFACKKIGAKIRDDFSTIVPGTEKITYLIDGQQRITTISLILIAIVNALKNKAITAMGQVSELEAELESGNYITTREAEKRIKEAKKDAEKEYLDNIREMMESGATTLTLLETLYPEQIIVSNEGRYYFFDITCGRI